MNTNAYLSQCITVANTPCNMHLVYHTGRREARIKALKTAYEKDATTKYVDTAQYSSKMAHAVSVTDRSGKELSAATVILSDTDSVEEAAIALATTTCQGQFTIFTDLPAACRNFQKGLISTVVLNVLHNSPHIHIVWAPGHDSFVGNIAADAAARGHTNSAYPRGDRSPTPIPKQYTDMLEHYRLHRRKYLPPHPMLSREEVVHL